MEYVNIPKGTLKYEGCDRDQIIDAQYTHARFAGDRGDRRIEALPAPLEGEALERVCSHPLPGYRYGKAKTKLDKIIEVEALTSVRFMMPFEKKLSTKFYNVLLKSYRMRREIDVSGQNITYIEDGVEHRQGTVSRADPADATSGSCSIVGVPGCGKNAAIKEITSQYPRALRHEDPYGYSIQIVYLLVNCTVNSNVKSVLNGIGAAIDFTLGNENPVYEARIKKENTIAAKASEVTRLIRRFSIGALILDEVQMLDFSSNKENSFQVFLSILNETAIALVPVGCDDAVKKMFSKLHMARRVGEVIYADKYCANKPFFAALVKDLFHYQWFNELVEPTEDIIDALYDVTRGIIEQLISIYTCVTLDYLEKKKKPVVNGDYIRSVANSRYPGIQKILKQMDMDGLLSLNETVYRENAEYFDSVEQQREALKLVDHSGERASERDLLEDVTVNVVKFLPYTPVQVEAAFKKVIARKDSKEKREDVITGDVIIELCKEPKRQNPKAKVTPPAEEVVRNYIDTEGGEAP